MTRRFQTVRTAADGCARELDLAVRIRDGDQPTFEALIADHAQALVAFAFRYTKDADVATDLVQDVFAALWERRETFVVRSSVKAYLYAAVRNRALNALRHDDVAERFRERSRTNPANPTVSPSTSNERAERNELALAVSGAFDALTPKARDVARLWFLEEMTQPEIAQALGLTLVAVGNHVLRAGKRLRALLSDVWP